MRIAKRGPILLGIVSTLKQYLSGLAGRKVANEGDRHERFAFLQEAARHLHQRQDGLEVAFGRIADLPFDHGFFIACASWYSRSRPLPLSAPGSNSLIPTCIIDSRCRPE